METIHTSNKAWVQELSRSYKRRSAVTLIDDAQIGINPETDTILQMGQKASLGVNDWVAVVVALGVAAAGAYLLVMAILDPEPFSKIAFAIGSGAVLTMGGGFAAMRVLTKTKPPKVKVTSSGFEIAWE